MSRSEWVGHAVPRRVERTTRTSNLAFSVADDRLSVGVFFSTSTRRPTGRRDVTFVENAFPREPVAVH